MAEDEETATARYIAANVSTQLMLKTIIEIISTMSDDSDKRMQRGPAVRDGGGHRRAVLRRTATGTDELGVDPAEG